MTYEVPDDEFLRMVQYFYEAKDDPTRYVHWDESRFRELNLYAHTMWRDYERARRLCDDAMSDMSASNSDGSFDA